MYTCVWLSDNTIITMGCLNVSSVDRGTLSDTALQGAQSDVLDDVEVPFYVANHGRQTRLSE